MTSNMGFFPFAKIKETRTYPHARTLRSDFLTKFGDTFNVFSGIFDYVTFFVPYGLCKAIEFLVSHDNFETNYWIQLVSTLLMPIESAFEIARFTFSGLATLLFLPIIVLVHGVSVLIAKDDYKKAMSLVGEIKKDEPLTLEDYLDENNLAIDELSFVIQKSTEESNGDIYYNLIQHDSHIISYDIPRFSVKLSPDKDSKAVKQAANIHSLFKLNIGHIVTNIEGNENIGDEEKKTLLSI